MSSIVPAGLTMNAIYAEMGQLAGLSIVVGFIILGLALYWTPRFLRFLRGAGKGR